MRRAFGVIILLVTVTTIKVASGSPLVQNILYPKAVNSASIANSAEPRTPPSNQAAALDSTNELALVTEEAQAETIGSKVVVKKVSKLREDYQQLLDDLAAVKAAKSTGVTKEELEATLDLNIAEAKIALDKSLATFKESIKLSTPLLTTGVVTQAELAALSTSLNSSISNLSRSTQITLSAAMQAGSTITPASVTGTLLIDGSNSMTGGLSGTSASFSGGASVGGTLAVMGLTSLVQASSTRLSVFDTLYVGGSATTTIDSSGLITARGLAVTSTTATTTLSSGGFAIDTNKFVVQQSSGNIGIGTTSPYAKLSVVGEVVGAYFTATTTTASVLPYLFSTQSTSTTFAATTASTTNLTVSGTLTLLNDLSVANGGTGLSAATAGYSIIGFDATTLQATSSIFTTPLGNVGIGTTTPYAKLTVWGNASNKFFEVVNNSSTTLFQINNTGVASTSGLVVSNLATFNGVASTSELVISNSVTFPSALSGVPLLANGALSVDSDGLDVSQGGTGTTTFYAGGIVFSDGVKLTQTGQQGSLYWAGQTGSLGVGTTTPAGSFQSSSNTLPQLVLGYPAGGVNTKNWYASSTGLALTFGYLNDDMTTKNERAALAQNGMLTLAGGLQAGNSSWSITNTSDAYFYPGVAGAVGIGTSTPMPGVKLQVAANNSPTPLGTSIILTDMGATLDKKHWALNSFAGDFRLEKVSDLYSPSAASLVVTSTGNLGIGTSTPNWLLQAAGTRPFLALSDTSVAAPNLRHWTMSSQGGNLYFATSSDALATSSVSALIINSDGQIFMPSVFTNTVGQYVCIAGPGGGSILMRGNSCAPSSGRFKENIKTLSYGLDTIKQLKPVSFTYKPEFDPYGDGRKQIGFIAEDVLPFVPEIVAYGDNGAVTGLDYDKLTAVLIKSVQEQQVEIDAIRSSIGSSNLSIDTNGDLVAKTLTVSGVVELGSASNPIGVTLYDTVTKEAKCLTIANSTTLVSAGKCGLSGEITSPSTPTSVLDTLAPTVTLNGNNPANLLVGDSYSDMGVVVSDNVDQNLGYQTTGDTVNTAVPGTYTVIYTAEDNAHNIASTTRTVIVSEPEILAPAVQ